MAHLDTNTLLVSQQPLTAELQEKLSRSGLCVTAVHHLQDALDQLAKHAPDVVLVMVDSDADDSLAFLKRLLSTAAPIPVVAVCEDDGTGYSAQQVGVHDYLLREELGSRLVGKFLAALLKRVQTDQVWREITLKYRKLIDQSTDGIVITDENGTVIEWNLGMERLTGLPHTAILGKPAWDVQFEMLPHSQKSPAMHMQLREMVLRGLHTGQFEQSDKLEEREIVGPGGQKRFMQSSLFSIPTGRGFMAASINRDVTAQHQIQDELRKLSRAVEDSPAAVIISDPKGNIEYVNSRFTEITGYTREEVIGQHNSMVRSVQVASNEHAHLLQTIETNGVWQAEFLAKRKNGDSYWEAATISAVKDTHDQITHYLGVMQDITERKQMEVALRASEDRLRGLLENLPVSLWEEDFSKVKAYLDNLKNEQTVDLETYLAEHPEVISSCVSLVEIIDANQAALDLHGAKDKAELLENLDKTFIPESYQAFGQELLAIWNGEYHQKIEGAVQTLDGERRDVMVHWSVPPGYEQTLSRVMISLVDITERKRMEAALRASEERFRSLVNSLSTVVVTLDREGKLSGFFGSIVQNNSSTVRQFVGKTASDIFSGAAAEVHEQAINRALAGSQVVYEWQGAFPHVIHFQNTISPVYNAMGEVTELVVVGQDITRYKQTEEALLDAERFFRSSIDALVEEIAILDDTGRVLAVNKAWCDFAIANGADPLHVCEGANYIAVLNVTGDSEEAREIATFAEGLQAVLSGRQAEFEMEYACPSPSEERWFIVHVTRFLGEGTVRVAVTHENITRRKQAEQAIQDANKHLMALNRVISLASSSLDSQTVLQVACGELARIFRVPQVTAALIDDDGLSLRFVAENKTPKHASVIGTTQPIYNKAVLKFLNAYKIPLAIINPPHDTWADDDEVIVVSPDTPSHMIIPIFVQEKLFGILQVEASAQRKFTQGEIVLAASIAHAVSQPLENSLLHREVAQHNALLEVAVHERTAELQRLNQQIATILDNSGDAILLVTGDGVIERTNPAFRKLFLYEQRESSGLPIRALAGESPEDDLFSQFQKVLATGTTTHFQITAVRKDKTSFDADVVLSGVPTGNSQVVCSVRDITALKDVERMKDRFIHMVSHELRTPLTSILFSANSLKAHDQQMTHEQRLMVINRLQTQTNVLGNLVETILELSQVISRPSSFEQTQLDMHQVLESVLTEMQPFAEAQELQLEASVAPDLDSQLTGSEADFKRVWHNLLSNAVKYTPPQGRITIRLGSLNVKEDGTVTIAPNIKLDGTEFPSRLVAGDYLIGQVEDTGHGIPQDDLDSLFSRFFRGWAALSNIPGTGLGLMLVRELLAFYNGGITVTSEVNRGSCFTFWLPRLRNSATTVYLQPNPNTNISDFNRWN